MHTQRIASLTTAALLTACGATNDAGARVGELEVALTSRLGEVDYHLTGATLRIEGVEPREISLDGPGSLELALPAGPYQLTLEEGWSLARDQEGELEPVAAQLLSENPTSLFLGAGTTEQLSFRFALEDGEVLQSGEGELQVGFELADGGVPDDAQPGLGCAGRLRLNEVDYDQQSSDDAEFVEVLNAGVCDASLEGVALELVNGSNGEVYGRVELAEAGVLAAQGTLVVADQGVLDLLPADAPGVLLPGSGLQNGPDSVRLVVGDAPVDVLGYGEGAPDAEGASAGEDGTDTSLGRCPDGFDTEDNARDFVEQVPTPGAANAC